MSIRSSSTALLAAILGVSLFISVSRVESQSTYVPHVPLTEQIHQLKVQVAELQRGSSPIGSIIAFAGPSPALPGHWLPCDGRALAQSEFRELFDVIRYGYGDSGAGTFRIPNLHDRFLLGNSDAKESGGEWIQRTSEDGVHQHGIEEVPKHAVEIVLPLPGRPKKTVQVVDRRWFGDDNEGNQFRNAKDGNHNHTVTVKPPYTASIFMIRVK